MPSCDVVCHSDIVVAGGRSTEVEYRLRLCHVTEQPNFDGFGFSVNTLRDLPGQFIGKVDHGSPAAAASINHHRQHYHL